MSKSVCIVGAGPSGLVAAKTLLHNAPKGHFKVSVFDSQAAIGGLWPTSKTDSGRLVHPLMVANQSRHTVQFSDLAWEDSAPQFPRAWQIGKYLEQYQSRYLDGHPDFELQLKSRVAKTEKRNDGSVGWKVRIQSEGGEESRDFDYLVVATGYFGKPIIPDCFKNANTSVPIIHSSQYRDLKGLLGEGRQKGGKILIVGGQMSGVEIAGTVASHLSAAVNSQEESEIAGVDKYSIYHAIQRPIWVFPLFTSPEPTFSSAPFAPLDLGSYNINNRPRPLENTQGHISDEHANMVHTIFETSLGDQEQFSSLLMPSEEERDQPAYLAVSDWYTEFVRSGMITLSFGKVISLENDLVTLDDNGAQIDDIAAVILATGFDPSPGVDFLPQDILDTLQHSPQHYNQALALAFHGTHHPDVPSLGFVGFYRSPYWGVMQMHARFIAELWSNQADNLPDALQRKLQADDSIRRTLNLRDDPRLSQFPMGDYMYLMQEFSEALSIPIHESIMPEAPTLSRNNLPLDTLTPARYPSPSDDAAAKDEAEKSLKQTRDLAIECLITPRFVARGVFRSLLGEWRLERDLTSRLPSHPSGTFVGTAQFLLRERTPEGLQCAADPNSITSCDEDGGEDLEYLYVEDGEFKTTSGFGFRATRRYIWRYDSKKDVISVWFAKPDDQKRADYLFHEIEFESPPSEDKKRREKEGWKAKAGHLCIDDYYNVKYDFAFNKINLAKWSIEYTVNGPKKDYTIHGTYERI
ncbi:dimethylaniline monooxygenase [N-oxide-forming] 1 [Trichoderma asperellum]|uniref:Dimethylaniline monooxygenase [N-oxide-forming] 1 n=1 Tax=Trichoderma asperellum TaxID=101201 RepID=A0A6V8R499_TRIAP|nr:dimethylaniline monooxygenase [N-oxide-forming] 1 [Trichoderma asperellum]